MAAERNIVRKGGPGQAMDDVRMVYQQDTPRWRRYYQQVRKTIRFPRHYNRSVNW